MNRLLLILCVLFAVGLSVVTFPDGPLAVLLVTFLSLITIFLIRRYTEDSRFLVQIFLSALLVRMILGAVIFYFELYNFFGPDAGGYNLKGQLMTEFWFGQVNMNDPATIEAISMSGGSWGMNYLTGVLYAIFGPSMLVVQSFSAVFGAATAPMIYFCAKQIYVNQRVARLSAIAIAFFPSFIIWSSQMLKDGFIVFLLVLAMTMVFQLQKKFSYAAIGFLIFSLIGIMSLRFYIFYMVAAAITGSFIIGISSSTQSLVRRTVAITIVGLALTYFGILRTATTDFETFGTVDRLQISRQYAGVAGDSGFAGEGDIDVSTPLGMISVLPIGFAYLILAPFPWQVSNFRQAATLPEIFLWWALIPLAISGLWFTLKSRLRNAVPVLIFTLMLTLVYSLYQGNTGTAYRQRTQIQVFLFMFIAVGWGLRQEQKENKRLMIEEGEKQFANRMQNMREIE